MVVSKIKQEMAEKALMNAVTNAEKSGLKVVLQHHKNKIGYHARVESMTVGIAKCPVDMVLSLWGSFGMDTTETLVLALAHQREDVVDGILRHAPNWSIPESVLCACVRQKNIGLLAHLVARLDGVGSSWLPSPTPPRSNTPMNVATQSAFGAQQSVVFAIRQAKNDPSVWACVDALLHCRSEARGYMDAALREAINTVPEDGATVLHHLTTHPAFVKYAHSDAFVFWTKVLDHLRGRLPVPAGTNIQNVVDKVLSTIYTAIGSEMDWQNIFSRWMRHNEKSAWEKCEMIVPWVPAHALLGWASAASDVARKGFPTLSAALSKAQISQHVAPQDIHHPTAVRRKM